MRIAVVIGCLLLQSCVVHELSIVPVETAVEQSSEPVIVESPVKAHLKDGSTVVFENGIRVQNGIVYGQGRIYDMSLQGGTVVQQIALDDIAAMESYQTPVNTAATVGGSVAGGTLATLGVLGGLMVLFGSCPTVYSFDGGTALLEAETFSYSIAPSFQARDIDRLGLSPRDNLIELELRNEMLETHYIDQLELLEIVHAPGTQAIPDHKGRALVYHDSVAAKRAVDQAGNDVTAVLQSIDSSVWQASDERLTQVGPTDYTDHLDLEFDVPDDASDLAVLLRLRNSLLSTVMLYDVMLDAQGFGALDWMGSDLQRVGNWLELGLWYRQQMGLHVSAWDGRRYRDIGRLPDQGPIAWSERAIRVPAAFAKEGRIRLRLEFVTDNWRIDQVALATDVRRARTRQIPVSTVFGAEGARPDIPAFLKKADKQYLISKPRDRLRLVFEVGDVPGEQERSFFLASEGYYMEWMRTEWLQEQHSKTFEPEPDAVLRALEIWRAVRDDYREKFESTKVAVR